MMQDLVGIVRNEEEMHRALDGIKKLCQRAENVSVAGNVEFNPGWHTCLDLQNLLTVSEAITLSAIERKESRGAQFREDFPEKKAEFSTFNIAVRKDSDGGMRISRDPIPAINSELKQIIDEMG